MQWGLFAQTDRALLTLFSRGLYEYTYEEEGQIHISLMRFVGLIREDLISYSAEEANRMGVHLVEYALGLWPPGEMASALRAMHEYSLPPRHFQVFERLQELPAAGLRWSNPYWMLSAWKPAEEGEGTVLRFWNASDTEQTGTVEYAGGLEGGILARLDEAPLGPLPTQITARPKEIVTIILQQSGT
jgi:alpha-mannosidase